MTQQADITLADGQTTPVNHIFRARGVTAGVATYKDTSSGSVASYTTLTISSTDSPSPMGSQKVSVRFAIPVMELPVGSNDTGYQATPKVAFYVFGKQEFVIPNRATAQNRKDIHAYLKNMSAHAVMQAIVVDNDPPI